MYAVTDRNGAFSWYRQKDAIETAQDIWGGIQMIREVGELIENVTPTK